MPWKVTQSMQLRTRFIADALKLGANISALARAYNISRKTANKWLVRYRQEGPKGLHERSRAPHSPRSVDDETREMLLEFRRQHPTWGPRKVRKALSVRHADLQLPATSTIGEIFKKHGLVKPRRRRRKRHEGSKSEPLGGYPAPNAVWCTDFKGRFKLLNGQYCHPLTITDGCTRFLLCCQAFSGETVELTKRAFVRVFKEYGLPEAIRSDNGRPFSSTAPLGLSVLSVWWIKLGIKLQRIDKGKPYQNGRHERMHRTLKAETTKPPAANMRSQQKRFDSFRREFNEERPHQSLEDETPASCYQASPRRYPKRIREPEYPRHYETRRVKKCGEFRFRGSTIFLSQALAMSTIGMIEIDDGIWTVYFSNFPIGNFNERSKELSFVRSERKTKGRDSEAKAES